MLKTLPRTYFFITSTGSEYKRLSVASNFIPHENQIPTTPLICILCYYYFSTIFHPALNFQARPGCMAPGAKPNNIFLAWDGRLAIGDFGLAKPYGDGARGPAGGPGEISRTLGLLKSEHPLVAKSMAPNLIRLATGAWSNASEGSDAWGGRGGVGECGGPG